MISKSLVLLIVFSFTLATLVQGQETLSKSEAMALALEYNFDIRTANNNINIAENNASITNSGYLPSLSTNGSANYSIASSENTLQTGDIQSASGVNTARLSASVGLNYTLFDGFGREYNYRKLKENYKLSELQARLVIENSLLNLFSVYYEIARLTLNNENQKESMDISKERWVRAKYSFEYGQNTQLDVLNAEVDYNTDSINYLTIRQQLENEKRNLNLLLGRDVNTLFLVDTTLQYVSGLNKEALIEEALYNNVNILQEQGAIRNTEYDLRTTGANTIPKIGLSASYGVSHSNLGATFIFREQNQWGPTLGATLSWNIYDGGLTSTRKQNAKILLENQQISMEQTRMEIERNVSNAWSIYQTALFVLQAESKNLETNQRNFDRTKDQYTLGLITSIEFRQAQLNLLNARLNFSRAKYSAKIAELTLLQFSGELLQAAY